MAKCPKHPVFQAIARCENCAVNYCGICIRVMGGEAFCPECGAACARLGNKPAEVAQSGSSSHTHSENLTSTTTPTGEIASNAAPVSKGGGFVTTAPAAQPPKPLFTPYNPMSSVSGMYQQPSQNNPPSHVPSQPFASPSHPASRPSGTVPGTTMSQFPSGFPVQPTTSANVQGYAPVVPQRGNTAIIRKLADFPQLIEAQALKDSGRNPAVAPNTGAEGSSASASRNTAILHQGGSGTQWPQPSGSGSGPVSGGPGSSGRSTAVMAGSGTRYPAPAAPTPSVPGSGGGVTTVQRRDYRKFDEPPPSPAQAPETTHRTPDSHPPMPLPWSNVPRQPSAAPSYPPQEAKSAPGTPSRAATGTLYSSQTTPRPPAPSETHAPIATATATSASKVFVAVCDAHHNDAVYCCEKCNAYYCDDCAKDIHGTKICPVCAGPLRAPRDSEKGIQPKKFMELVGYAFTYPFAGEGLILFPLGVLFCSILSAGLIFSIIKTFFCSAYFLKIVRDAANGNIKPPNFPSNFVMEWLVSYLEILACVALCVFPAILISHFTTGIFVYPHHNTPYQLAPQANTPEGAALLAQEERDNANLHNRLNMEPDNADNEDSGPRLSFVFVITALLGLCFFPMAIIMLSLFRTWEVLNPLLLLNNIGKIPTEYAIACGVLIFILFFEGIAGPILRDMIPYMGSLIGSAFSFYFLEVEAFIIGILYFHKRKELGWFGSST